MARNLGGGGGGQCTHPELHITPQHWGGGVPRPRVIGENFLLCISGHEKTFSGAGPFGQHFSSAFLAPTKIPDWRGGGVPDPRTHPLKVKLCTPPKHHHHHPPTPDPFTLSRSSGQLLGRAMATCLVTPSSALYNISERTVFGCGCSGPLCDYLQDVRATADQECGAVLPLLSETARAYVQDLKAELEELSTAVMASQVTNQSVTATWRMGQVVPPAPFDTQHHRVSPPYEDWANFSSGPPTPL